MTGYQLLQSSSIRCGGFHFIGVKTMDSNKVTEIRKNILSGLTVALALVPEAVAFAFVAHVHPLVSLYAAFMVA